MSRVFSGNSLVGLSRSFVVQLPLRPRLEGGVNSPSRARHSHREDARPMGHPPASAQNDPAHGKTRLGVGLERGITHLLLDLEAARLVLRSFGNGFVNVSRH